MEQDSFVREAVWKIKRNASTAFKATLIIPTRGGFEHKDKESEDIKDNKGQRTFLNGFGCLKKECEDEIIHHLRVMTDQY